MQNTKASKKHLNIGEVARQLGVKKNLVHRWEKEFGVLAGRVSGRSEMNAQEKLELFVQIKELLCKQGKSIADVRAHISIADAETTQATLEVGATCQVNLMTAAVVDRSEQESVDHQVDCTHESLGCEQSTENTELFDHHVLLTAQLTTLKVQLLKLRTLLQE